MRTTKQAVATVMQLTKDSVENAFSALGTAMDKHKHTMPSARGTVFAQQQINDLYYHSTLMRRIVDRPARDALKRGFEVRFEEKELTDWVESEMKRLQVLGAVRKAARLARKDGGSGIVIVDAGDEKLINPAPQNARIIRLRTHSRYKLGGNDVELSYASPNWDKPKTYRLPSTTPQTIHHSRVVRFVGLDVDEDVRAHYQYWGQSVIESCWPAYADLSTCSVSLATQMHDAVYNVLKLKGLAAVLSRKDGKALLDDRIEVINMGKSLLRTLVLDEGETYETVATDLSKLIQPFEIFAQILSADSNLPLTFLFGQSPAGFNSTDLNAIESYYEFVEGIQEDELTPGVEQLVRLILSQKGLQDEQFDVVWPPIEKPDELTASTVRGAVIKADLDLYSIGAMDAMEIRARHYGEGFQPDMTLEEGAYIEPPPMPAQSTQPVQPIQDTLVSDALARMREGAKSTMICLAPPPEWTARFRSMFPDAQPNTHLTLKYCGHLTDDEVLSLFAELKGDNGMIGLSKMWQYPHKVEIKIKGHGGFYSNGKFCEILLAEPTQALQSLQAAVSSMASNVASVPTHDFLPHVTINYHEQPFMAQPVETVDFPVWTVHSVLVVQNDEVIADIGIC